MRIFILSIIILSVSFGEESQFSTQNFTIKAPSGIGNGQGVVTMIFLPAKNGFAGNVNVMIQEYAGTILEYNDLSQSQFKQMGLSIIEVKLNTDSVIYEYEGKSGQHELHWYSRAIKRDNRMYLITATSLLADWPGQKEALIQSVDSFKFNK
jgi:hypothetical protein